MLSLGPMPASVRAVVERLVAEAQREPRLVESRQNGFFLTGGPTGCSFLDADGEAWNWWYDDDAVDSVKDGPLKVGMIALAAERVPELAEWLPRRPQSAPDCHVCKKTGKLPPPFPPIQCPECSGMGWLSE